ncbi:AAA family ATPase [Streptomyces griseoaurantiacus]|uniref:AAA family ATPase n=1 Tax=Streptomyces griseoaurantiacus TaxID=68213 RepID=UPI00346053CF
MNQNPEWAENVKAESDAHNAAENAPEENLLPKSFTPGGTFFLQAQETPPAVWGEGGDVLWAEGESLILAGPQGVGKTTIAHQIIRARLGLQDTVLGLPVQQGSKRVLMLMMDRPAQARRAGRRIYGNDDEGFLNEHLVIWEGPPPYDLAKRPDVLAAMCERAKADTVLVDSIKDGAIGISADEVGAGYNRARQKALAEGVQVLENHHTKKAGANGGEPNKLEDVYGSVWITAGSGSVIMLWGEAGDPIVSFRHIKQPMNEVGPFQLLHDHASGLTTVRHTVDLLDMARIKGVHGLTVMDAAAALAETKKPTASDREKARRKLNKLVEKGLLSRVEPPSPGDPTRWFPGRSYVPSQQAS